MRAVAAAVIAIAISGCGDPRAGGAPRRVPATDASIAREPLDAADPVDAIPPRSGLDDALVVACIGAWRSGVQVLKLWGDHPDYEPDYATAYRIDDPLADFEEFRYQVDSGRLRLWRPGRSSDVVDVPFTLVRDEGDLVYRYELRLGGPVLGQRVFEGEMPSSYYCRPRPD